MVGASSKVNDEELDLFVKSFELLKKVPAAGGSALAAADTPPPPASPTVAASEDSPPAQAEQTAPTASPTVAANEEPMPQPADQPAPAASPTATVADDSAPAEEGKLAPSDGSTAVADNTPAQPARTTGRPAANRTPPAARSVRRAPRGGPGAGGSPVLTADEGPDPAKPAEKAIHLTKSATRFSERPAPNGNESERFRAVGPKHGLLVGMRVGYVNAFGGSKVGAVQPIFQVDSTYSEGDQFGGDLGQGVTIVAKAGYAVGAINTRAGLLLDAFQIVFMKYKSGRLDPKDSYTTDWIGDPRGGGLGGATGGGRLVVGIHGRSNGREINSLGLVVAE
jgi:hypothetical protein